VRLLDGQPRTELLKHLGWDKAAQQAPGRYATVQCNRRLSPAYPIALSQAEKEKQISKYKFQSKRRI